MVYRRGVTSFFFQIGQNQKIGRAEFDSAPGAEKTTGGAENLIIPRERGRNV